MDVTSLILVVVLWLWEKGLVPRKYTLKYSGVTGHQVAKLFSDS